MIAPTEPAGKPAVHGVSAHLPERPRLAPGLRLAGQMRESAFVEPPWLLEREGAGYIQLTELLYRVVEQCTGQRSVEDIADQVSLATGRRVSADNVRYLLARCLLPRGLVLPANGATVPPGDSSSQSLLALTMRTRLLSPRLIDPAARLLSRLYWPPLLLAILCVAAVGEGWLYLVHGVSGSLHDVLYTPALMLLVVAALVVSAAFHEFGHAAALTYGGGKVKAMGVGLYLVYPAFYTDVSDNYRLPRWARVRTDLGGFYFNLLVGLGLLGLYARTGQEFLLLIVLLINLEILHQLVPFVRLDGYWALADLTGLPDFFTYTGAFLADVLPIQLGTRGKLPPLKRWARVVFAAYLLIAVPLLGTLVFLMVRGFPRILATAWDSMHQQGIALVQARAIGDGLAMSFAVLQMGLLALPTECEPSQRRRPDYHALGSAPGSRGAHRLAVPAIDAGHRGRHRRADRVGGDRDRRPPSGATFSVVQHATHHPACSHWHERANVTANLDAQPGIGVYAGDHRTDSRDHGGSHIGPNAGAHRSRSDDHASSKAAPTSCCDGHLQPSFRALTEGQVSVPHAVSPI